MTEDKSPPPDPNPTPTPAGNQNLIIGLVLGAVVLLLFFLVLQMSGGGSGGGDSEVDKLKAERDARKEALANQSGGSAAAGAQSARNLAARLSSDSTTLADLVTTMQAMLAKTETDLANANTVNRHLSQQLANSSASAADNVQLKAQLAQAQTRAAQSDALVSSLQQQLNTSHTKSEMDAVRGQLEKALLARDSYQRQVTELSEQMRAMEDSGVAKALRQERDDLKDEVSKLKSANNKYFYEIQELRAKLDLARLYVEAEALPAKAKLLYDELAKLETATPAELAEQYKRIEQDLGASVVETIRFQTGSSNVTRDDAEKINRKVQTGGNESFFLVVGYASKSGGLANNKQLSASRATRIASVTNFHKKSEQGVNAVFLAETDRFGADLPANQVCEIWELRK